MERKEGRETLAEMGHTQPCDRSVSTGDRKPPLSLPLWRAARLTCRQTVVVWKECQQRRHRYNHPRSLHRASSSFLFQPLQRQTRTSSLRPSHIKLSFNTASSTESFGTRLRLAHWGGKVYIINDRNFRSKAICPEVLIGIN